MSNSEMSDRQRLAGEMGNRLTIAREAREAARARLFGSIDIMRAEVRRARAYGMSSAEVARMAGVSVMTVHIWTEE